MNEDICRLAAVRARLGSIRFDLGPQCETCSLAGVVWQQELKRKRQPTVSFHGRVQDTFLFNRSWQRETARGNIVAGRVGRQQKLRQKSSDWGWPVHSFDRKRRSKTGRDEQQSSTGASASTCLVPSAAFKPRLVGRRGSPSVRHVLRTSKFVTCARNAFSVVPGSKCKTRSLCPSPLRGCSFFLLPPTEFTSSFYRFPKRCILRCTPFLGVLLMRR